MCGILGILNLEKIEERYPLDILMWANYKRGQVQTAVFGKFNEGSFCNRNIKEPELIMTPSSFETKHETNIFYHFRAPTTGCDLKNMKEAYPLEYNGWKVIGNGVINEGFFKMIKDEENNNDLYYILKNVVNNGWEWLENVKGVYALAFFKPNGKIFLVRNTYPLFYNKTIFSSVVTEGLKPLKSNIVYDFTNGRKYKNINMVESPFML